MSLLLHLLFIITVITSIVHHHCVRRIGLEPFDVRIVYFDAYVCIFNC